MASGVMDKSPDAFRTISEVAEDLDVPQHVLRFWETRFSHIKPLKRGGGRRYYRPDDVDLLKGIRHLLYGEGYTIKGVQRILKEEGVRFVQARSGGASRASPRFIPRLSMQSRTRSAVCRGRSLRRRRVEHPHVPLAARHCLAEALRGLKAALDELYECDRVLVLPEGRGRSLPWSNEISTPQGLRLGSPALSCLGGAGFCTGIGK